jgi:ribosomal protein L20A (L18A)
MNKEYIIDLYFTARKTITVYALDRDDAAEKVWQNLDLPDDVRVKEVDIVDIEEEENHEE